MFILCARSRTQRLLFLITRNSKISKSLRFYLTENPQIMETMCIHITCSDLEGSRFLGMRLKSKQKEFDQFENSKLVPNHLK